VPHTRIKRIRDTVSRRRSRFINDLILLNHTIATTPLDQHYWVSGGLLLGWARERKLLDNDYHDADFGILASDRSLFLSAIASLKEAGFRPLYRWRNNSYRTTEWVLEKNGARFEFFEYEKKAPNMLRNFGYFPMECSWEEVSAKHPFVIEQVELLLPDQPRVPFTFLEVDWLKAQDHELELDSLYGPRWRASRDEFYSTPWITGHHSPAVVVREPWKVTNFDWDGSIDGP